MPARKDDDARGCCECDAGACVPRGLQQAFAALLAPFDPRDECGCKEDAPPCYVDYGLHELYCCWVRTKGGASVASHA